MLMVFNQRVRDFSTHSSSFIELLEFDIEKKLDKFRDHHVVEWKVINSYCQAQSRNPIKKTYDNLKEKVSKTPTDTIQKLS